ncbi:MAG: 23S rRNA pseudouridine1911/1915/1917 synthase [Paraglaciecola sp.]|jgi:23S rRNA pseudouridine1911/1915/1917 synthase
MQIIHEDNHLIAVNKPAGWLVQGDATGDKPLSDRVKDYIKRRYKKPGDVFLGVIHRIDRPVSGVVIFARTSKALERMNKLFADREVQKTYWAITTDRPEPIEGELGHFLLKDKTKNKTKAYHQIGRRTSDAKWSELSYKLIAGIGDNQLLEVKPISGRSHQIRVQLSAIGCPIKGDLKYGATKANEDASIHLHSRRLEFIHPVKKTPVIIEADLPDNQLWNLFSRLKL